LIVDVATVLPEETIASLAYRRVMLGEQPLPPTQLSKTSGCDDCSGGLLVRDP